MQKTLSASGSCFVEWRQHDAWGSEDGNWPDEGTDEVVAAAGISRPPVRPSVVPVLSARATRTDFSKKASRYLSPARVSLVILQGIYLRL